MGGKVMVKIVFVTTHTGVVFTVPSKEIAQKTIREFEDVLSRVTKEQDQLLWGEDLEGNKVSMIRCSQVLGFYILEEEESWKR